MCSLTYLTLVMSFFAGTLESSCQATYENGLATTPLNVCQTNSGTSSTSYTCVNGIAYYNYWFENGQCSGVPLISPTPLSTAQPDSIAKCTGPSCDYVKIRFYTADDCSAGSTYGDFAIVTNQCNVDASNSGYKSWINICTASSYASIQFVGSDCTGEIYDQPIGWTSGTCASNTNGRIDIVQCTNPTTRYPTMADATPEPTTGEPTTSEPTNDPSPAPSIQTSEDFLDTLTPSKAPVSNNPTMELTIEPTFEPTMEPTNEPIMFTSIGTTSNSTEKSGITSTDSVSSLVETGTTTDSVPEVTEADKGSINAYLNSITCFCFIVLFVV